MGGRPTIMRLSSNVLKHRASRVVRAIRCGIPSMPAIASSAMPPTDALLSQMHTSTFAGPWTSTQHGGRDVSIKYGSKALSTSAGESRTPPVVHEGMAHKASQRLATRLHQEIRKGDSHAAWELFNAAKATGAADVLHWSMMLKLRDTSAERRIMMDEMMMEAGLEPTDMTYRTLVGQLILEGNLKEAQVVVGTEMPAVGIVPSKLTESLFKLSPGSSSKMRTDHLQKLIKTNAREKAQTFFEGLKVNGVADIYQWNLMQGQCETSAEQRSMMGGMTEAGVNPDCVTYNILTKRLMIEGRLDEARAVVETEMPAAGIEPNDRTHALFERPEKQWSGMRTQHLTKLLNTSTSEGRQQAQAFFEGLKMGGVADIYQWNLMRRLCETSAEQRSMMGDMTEAGVNPDCATYNILAKQLMFGGRLDEARAVVETEMPAAGIEPNDRTHSLLENLRRSGVKCERST